ncbi:EthD family reductase [Streptomyces sp. OE57]|uniref:EthD family reductase n=1 Tax=Streptomyces lacaronensis TaxID=3379885 RepID=UPI0039B75FBF
MIKVVALIKRKEGLTREEFLRYWQGEHPAVVRELPNVRHYTQSPAIEHRKQWAWDGVAQLWFDSVQDVSAAFRGAPADAMREHEEHFIGEMEWFLATETDVPLSRDAVSSS